MSNILRYRIVLPVIAAYLYLMGSAPYLGQWDSFDYLKQIVTHQFSDLGIGRPVYIGYNILLWETMRSIFRLDPIQVEIVIMAGTVLLGVLGVVLFQRLSRMLLPSPACYMAAIAFALSPLYAIYSGYIMTEVPMLTALLASALILWKPAARHAVLCDVAGGILFGLAVGIREQALTLGAAFLWILFIRRTSSVSRFRSMFFFGVTAAAVILAPALIFYIYDPGGFLERIKTWLQALPIGSFQFRNNVESSLLYIFVICPGAWFAVAIAGIYRLLRKRRSGSAGSALPANTIPHPFSGIICCLVLPVAVLWHDADVQMHPRYVLMVLPSVLILCASLFRNWIPSQKALVSWAVIQVLFFGIAITAFIPYRQTQIEKMEFALLMRDSIPDGSLIIAGNYSPVLDYYRGIGLRPDWRIVWSGWTWDTESIETKIRSSWADQVPVYLSTEPRGWFYLETEFLNLHFMLKDCKKAPIAPNLYRIYP